MRSKVSYCRSFKVFRHTFLGSNSTLVPATSIHPSLSRLAGTRVAPLHIRDCFMHKVQSLGGRYLSELEYIYRHK